MLGISAGIPELEDLAQGNPEQPCIIQAVVSWFGPTDFLKMDKQLAENGLSPQENQRHNEAESPESLLLGDMITKITEIVAAANPESYIRSTAPPFLSQHGTKDPVVPVQQSIEFATKLRRVLGEDKVMLDLLEGAEHADEKFETSANVTSVLDFLDSRLK